MQKHPISRPAPALAMIIAEHLLAAYPVLTGHRPKKVLHSGLLMHVDSMPPFGGAVTCDTCAPFDPAGAVAMKLAHDVTFVQVSAIPPAGGRTTVLVAAPAVPPLPSMDC
jgi:hypothetical protein